MKQGTELATSQSASAVDVSGTIDALTHALYRDVAPYEADGHLSYQNFAKIIIIIIFFLKRRKEKGQLVSWCFKPRQPQGVTSGPKGAEQRERKQKVIRVPSFVAADTCPPPHPRFS